MTLEQLAHKYVGVCSTIDGSDTRRSRRAEKEAEKLYNQMLAIDATQVDNAIAEAHKNLNIRYDEEIAKILTQKETK
jgi:hypothetical protein